MWGYKLEKLCEVSFAKTRLCLATYQIWKDKLVFLCLFLENN